MNFDNQFFKSLPADKYKAGIKIFEEIINFDRSLNDEDKYNNFSEYVDSYAAIEVFLESRELNYPLPKITKDRHKTIKEIINTCQQLIIDFNKQISDNELESARDKYKGLIEVGFVYSFTDGDIKQIQTLINELRDLITQSELFDTNHKERLLKKLEGLQNELHKKMASVDKFWGLMGDAGVALGKFGTDAKPFVDRIKEISQIIWRTQAKAEELPSGASIPFLESENK